MGMGKHVIVTARPHVPRKSISYKSPVAALKISRAMKRGARRAAVLEAWAMVDELARAA